MPQRFEGLVFHAKVRPPLAGPVGWLRIQNTIITPGGSAKTENKDNQTRRRVDLLGLKVDCSSSVSSLSLWRDKKGLGIGSCLWCVIDCVLRGLLLLLYFSNLIIRAILSWWESICIWTGSCSHSITQGVPEETETASVHMVWKRTPRSSSNMCGSADCWVFFFSSDSERLLNHLSCYCKCYNNNYKWFFAS